MVLVVGNLFCFRGSFCVDLTLSVGSGERSRISILSILTTIHIPARISIDFDRR